MLEERQHVVWVTNNVEQNKDSRVRCPTSRGSLCDCHLDKVESVCFSRHHPMGGLKREGKRSEPPRRVVAAL